MKYIKFALLPLAVFYLNTAHALAPSPKTVTLPFDREQMMTVTNQGLVFNYDMSSSKKIVCRVRHVHQFWFEYTDGSPITSTPITGPAVVIFTNLNSTTDRRYHADLTGSITIKSSGGLRNDLSDASCYYLNDQ